MASTRELEGLSKAAEILREHGCNIIASQLETLVDEEPQRDIGIRAAVCVNARGWWTVYGDHTESDEAMEQAVTNDKGKAERRVYFVRIPLLLPERKQTVDAAVEDQVPRL